MSNLNGTTWVFKDSITLPSQTIALIDFEGGAVIRTRYNNMECSAIRVTSSEIGYKQVGASNTTSVYSNSSWTYSKAKTITFLVDPEDYVASNDPFLEWLYANATLQVDTPYIAKESQLTYIADTIRTKGGTSDQIAFPDGFVSRINQFHQFRTTDDDFALNIGNSANYLPSGAYYKLKTYSNLYSQLLSNANVSSGTIQINKVSLPNTGNDIICTMRIYGTNNITFYAQNTGSGGVQLSANQAVLIEYSVAYYV